MSFTASHVLSAREAVRSEVLSELLEWEAHYMQQARDGNLAQVVAAQADAAREIHDHLRSSWETRELIAGTKPAIAGVDPPSEMPEATQQSKLLAMEVALLRIAAFPRTRKDEMSIEGAREIARAALAYCKPANVL